MSAKPSQDGGIVLLGELSQKTLTAEKKYEGQPPKQYEPLDSVYHRQGLIRWWDQQIVRDAKIFVMGAGAIGNETLKNLVLLGVTNIFICDMDTIEKSNLSRTLLFRRGDENNLKAKVAAQRLEEMSPDDNFKVDYFCGDVMYELGSGIFRRFDIVLGCLDNDATRFFIDKQCTLFGKPWVNAGIGELNWTLQVINSKKSACFHCGYSPEVIAQVISRKVSCGKTIISDLNAGKIPTVQVASAFVSALQTQEAIKIIHGQYDDTLGNDNGWGYSYSYQGALNEFSKSKMLADENCQNHCREITSERIIELPNASNSIALRDFLELLKADGRFTDEFELDLSEESGREFISQLYCVFCGKEIKIEMPRYKLKREHTFCNDCTEDMSESALICDSIKKFSLSYTPDEVLNLSLEVLGIPKLHILMIVDKNDEVHYVELTGDLCNVLPNIVS